MIRENNPFHAVIFTGTMSAARGVYPHYPGSMRCLVSFCGTVVYGNYAFNLQVPR